MKARTHLLFLLLLLLAGLPASSQAQNSHQAAVVVRFDDSHVESQCLSFSEEQITGLQVLQMAGFETVVDSSGIGSAVCSIGGAGCPASDCFCQCSGSDCLFWSYWHLVGGEWQFSQVGAALYNVGDGAVEGWSWGPGAVGSAIAPPLLTFADVCGGETLPTATAPATPTATATTPPEATPTPSVSFWADALTLTAGSCTVLHWQADNVSAVYFEGAGAMGHDSRQVCPAQDTSYSLRVDHGGGSETYVVSLTVLPNPATATVPAPATVLAPQATPPAGSTSPATPRATAEAGASPSPATPAASPQAEATVTVARLVQPPTPTATIRFMTAPRLATPTGQGVAAAPAAAGAIQATPVPPSPASPGAPPPAYWLFALLFLGLGGALWLAGRQEDRP